MCVFVELRIHSACCYLAVILCFASKKEALSSPLLWFDYFFAISTFCPDSRARIRST